MSLAVDERKKYEKAWAIPEYHNFSPAQNVLPLFKQMVKGRPKRASSKVVHLTKGTLLDIGAGTGRASQDLADLGWEVTMMDHVRVNKDSKLPFIKANIFGKWNKPPLPSGYSKEGVQHWDQGFCCDVMEHIPPEKVDAALKNITDHCDRVFFSINFNKDHFGAQIGHPLHLTVQPFMWWVAKLNEFGTVKAARDLMGEGVFDVVTS